MFKKLTQYASSGERWHEHGHVFGYACLCLLLMPLGMISKWMFVASPFIIFSWAIFEELVLEDWATQWKEKPWHRPDLFYDLWSKGILGPGLACLVTYAVRPESLLDFLLLPAISIAGLVLPYKFKFFQDRPH